MRTPEEQDHQQMLDDLQEVLTPSRVEQLLNVLDEFKVPDNSAGLCTYSASLLTSVLSKLMPDRHVRLGFGMHVDKWGNTVHHFFTIIDDDVFVDLTYDQFDSSADKVLVDRVDSLEDKYDIVLFEGTDLQTYEEKLENFVRKDARVVGYESFLVGNYSKTLAALAACPDTKIVPHDPNDPAAAEKIERLERAIDRF